MYYLVCCQTNKDNQTKMAQQENVKIYRFKISNTELYDQMVDFSHTNQFLDKQDLKEKYEEWLELPHISKMISEERQLLHRHEYDLIKNDINQKIFKSIKYYHIKNLVESRKMKDCEQDKPQVSSCQAEKKTNIKFSRALLEKVKEELDAAEDLKPSVCCANFMEKNDELLKEEEKLFEENQQNVDGDFDTRFKKMFKNQWYMKFKKGC